MDNDEGRNSRGYPVDYLRCLGVQEAMRPLDAPFPAMVRGSGPIIADVELNALFLGNFDVATQHTMTDYLASLAGWIRGEGAPNGQEPVVRQYGTTAGEMGKAVGWGTLHTKMTDADLHMVVATAQSVGKLPPFAPNRLFLIFTKGIAFDGHGSEWCGYHSAWADNAFYAYVPYPDVGGCGDDNPMASWQSVVSHEVMEAVTDPIPGSGWYAGDVQGEGGDGICAWHEVAMPFGTMQLFLDNRSQACSVWTPVAAPPEPFHEDYARAEGIIGSLRDQCEAALKANPRSTKAKYHAETARAAVNALIAGRP